ncbi:MAG: sulfatase-like hydrolase/transferase [Eubacteriales bacterium]|jgi:choline-sulfatase
MVNRAPNIIYILSDQHNAAVAGAYGDSIVRTPHMDQLAREGVTLENCYCASPLCVPSRTALLSGRLPSHTGVYNNMQCYPSDKATFVHALRLDGYETVLCGRMHFVGWDQRHGFETRLVGDITASFMGYDNEEEVYGDFKRTSYQHIKAIQKSGGGNSAVLQYDREVTDAALEYLTRRGQKEERPLFLLVGLYGPHCPYIAPPDLFAHYYRTLPPMGTVSREEYEALHPAMQKWQQNRELDQICDEDVRRIRAAYYGMVEYVDSLVGEIVEQVDRCFDPENTLVIYGSDHGDNIGEHGLFWKTNFYEGASHIPMIFRWKNHLQPGRRIGELTSLLDVAPTLLSLAGEYALPEYDGLDLMPCLLGEKSIPRDRVVFAECSDIKGDAPSAMLRMGPYKLIRHAGYEQPQLFDLEKDPHELHDLADKEAYREVRERLMVEMGVYWEPQRALRQLEVDLKHNALLSQWVRQVRPQPVEEWRGRVEDNYISIQKLE